MKIVNYSKLKKTDMNLYSIGSMRFSQGISYKLIAMCIACILIINLLIGVPCMAIMGTSKTYMNINFIIPMIVGPCLIASGLLKIKIGDFTIFQYIQGVISNIFTPDSTSLKGDKTDLKKEKIIAKFSHAINLEDN